MKTLVYENWTWLSKLPPFHWQVQIPKDDSEHPVPCDGLMETIIVNMGKKEHTITAKCLVCGQHEKYNVKFTGI